MSKKSRKNKKQPTLASLLWSVDNLSTIAGWTRNIIDTRCIDYEEGYEGARVHILSSIIMLMHEMEIVLPKLSTFLDREKRRMKKSLKEGNKEANND